MRIWVTRTQPGAAITAAKLKEMGHEAVVRPVLEAQAVKESAIDLSAVDALAFTSAQAVAAFAERTGRRDFAVFVVGRATAARAEQAGFASVTSADGNVAKLANLIVRSEAQQGWTVVWPRAEEPAGDLVSLLAARGVNCLDWPIYRTVPMAGDIPSGLDAILVHSPRGAEVVARRLKPGEAAGLALYAISENAAEPLKSHPFARVAIAPRPNETALLGLITG